MVGYHSWTEEDEATLLALIDQMGTPNWAIIAGKMTALLDVRISAESCRSKHRTLRMRGDTTVPLESAPTLEGLPAFFRDAPLSWQLKKREDESKEDTFGFSELIVWRPGDDDHIPDWDKVWRGYIESALEEGKVTDRQAERALGQPAPKWIRRYYRPMVIWRPEGIADDMFDATDRKEKLVLTEES